VDTKRLGNLGELKAMAKFAEYSIPIYIPFGETERSDFIADFNGALNKIQVKSTEKIVDGKMIFNLRSTSVNTVSNKSHCYNETEIDYFVLYCKENDGLYIINVQDAPRTGLYLDVSDFSSDNKMIRQAIEYELGRFLENL
jgi:hypothetical protein